MTIDLLGEQPSNDHANMRPIFHYFFVRKVMVVKYALASIMFPHGLGAIDELFGAVTLIQTRNIRFLTVILQEKGYWQGY